MRLKAYSYILSSVFVISLVLSALTLLLLNSRLTTTTALIGKGIESVRASEELLIRVLAHNREAFLLRLNEGEGSLARLNQAEADIYAWLASIKKYVNNAKEAHLVSEVEKAVIGYLDVRKGASSQELAAAESYLEAHRPLSHAYYLIHRLTETNISQAQELKESASRENRLAQSIGLMILLFCFVAFPLLWLSMRISIYNPLEEILRLINGAKQGLPSPDQDSSLTSVGGVKEINQIGYEFMKLLRKLDEKKKNQLCFLAGVAHDLRNPLNAIYMSAQVLDSDDIPRDEQKTVVNIISNQAKSLERMVGDFLDSTRIESGQLEVKKESHNISLLAAEAGNLYKQSSNLHQIVLDIDPEVHCECDPLRISQVLNNLVHNAIKYSPEGGEVRISLKENPEGGCMILVSDTGIGIAPEEVDQIFEPFRRSQLTSRSIPGVGLGLSVTRKIILAHGGTVEVQSIVGRGSTFRVNLPGKPSRQAAASAL